MATASSRRVFSPRTISTSAINGTGLKKCMPTTSSGRCTLAAMSRINREEVLEASTVPGRTCRLQFGEYRLFDARRSSTTASTTTSTVSKD